MGVRWVSDGCQIVTAQSTMGVRWVSDCHSSVHKTHALHNDGCQMGVRFVTAQSTRHMHYIMTCLSGDCVVLVTITVTTNLCTKETLCSPGVGCVRASLDYGARDTHSWVSDCHSSVHKTHALNNDMSEW